MDIFNCTECDKFFYQKRYLSAHIKRVHKKEAIEDPENKTRFRCNYCEKEFNSKNSESKHRIRTHGEFHLQMNIQCQEIDCTKQFSCLHEFRIHLKESHSFQNQDLCEEKTFNSKTDFEKWLAEEQQNSKCNFVLSRGEKETSSHIRKVYNCSRSGHFASQSKEVWRERQLKAQGSKKVGYQCTAQIVLKDYKDHSAIQYFYNHYKHDFRLSHLPLSQETKDIVAGKLLHGVSDNRILRDVRGSFDFDEERNNLFTRKDLNNIKQAVNPTNTTSSTFLFDETGVEIWVKNMKDSGTFIFDYKLQKTCHPDIEFKDFFLAFMMPIQQEMFKTFGGDRICIDSTHGMTGYDFQLVTVMVIDEYEEGFPIAFCLTSAVTLQTMTYFFKKLKNSVPEIVKTKVFMSDDEQLFYNAWETTFGSVEAHLLCSWHVDRAWQGHLTSIPLEKRKHIYKYLKSITYELNENVFLNSLTEFLKELEKDEETKAFHSYFIKYYTNRKEMWAYCHRKGARLNTNMHIEHFHREIKHIYLEGKKCKRVDKCCESLKNYITDKIFERYIKLQKGKITKKHTASYHRHKEGHNIISHSHRISENEWEVTSTTFPSKSYTVTKLHTCTDTCNILCRECICCLSSHKCTCHDFLILNNMCKHIHAVNIKYKDHQSYSGPLLITPSYTSDTTANVTKILQPTKRAEISKEMILNKITSLQSKLVSKSTIDQVIAQQIMTSLNTVENLLDINLSKNTIFSNNKEPANKKILPQKRFFSTKKQKAKKQKLNKPSRDEQLNATNSLLNRPYVSTNSLNDHNYID